MSGPERRRLRFSGSYECTTCHRPGREPEAAACSASTIPVGACPRLPGFGKHRDFDLNLVIPDPGLTLHEGAIDPWKPTQVPAVV